MLRRIAHLWFLLLLLTVSPAVAAPEPADAGPLHGPAVAAEAGPVTGRAPATAVPGASAAPDCGPDLIPYTPDGYSFPLVPNSVKHTTLYSSVLYAGKPTYFDSVSINNGTEMAVGTYYVDLWLDSTRFARYDVTNLPNDWYAWWNDWEYVVATPGWHTLTIVIDDDNLIAECDETNNVWQGDFLWDDVPAWWGEYYNNVNLTGDPVFVRADPAINFDWPGSPQPGVVNENAFSVRWTRTMSLGQPTYYFTLTRDNGMRFYFDDALIYDEWTDNVDEDSFPLDISPGFHSYRVEFFESGGTATARLIRVPCVSLTTSVWPTGSGLIEATPAGNCGAKYIDETVVSLRAVPIGPYHFTNWAGGLTGTQNPAQVTLSDNTSVTANFAEECYDLNLNVNPAGSGSIAADPPPDCFGGLYGAGTVVSLTAGANSGYTFANWSGDASGTANPRNVTMNGPRNVTANFTQTAADCRPLTLNRTGQGAVPQPTPAQSPGCNPGSFSPGAAVQLTAAPAAGWRVAGWRGTAADASTATTNSLTMPNTPGHTAGVDYVANPPAGQRVTLPMVLFGAPYGYLGPNEIEPNNLSTEATGPILLNRDYYGYPNDERDWFQFNLATTTRLTITLDNISGKNPQLTLFYHADFLEADVQFPWRIERTVPPGHYYVRVLVAGDYSTTARYTLRLSSP